MGDDPSEDEIEVAADEIELEERSGVGKMTKERRWPSHTSV